MLLTMASGRTDLLFEVVREARLVVSCQSKFNPSDDEWARWMTAASNLEHEVGQFRLLVVTEGGHPTKPQLDRLRAVNKKNPPTAIVSSSLALRFMGTALTFVNPTIRCFSPKELDEAFDHIGLVSAERSRATTVMQRLEKELLARAPRESRPSL
jgi:hypothetical protein